MTVVHLSPAHRHDHAETAAPAPIAALHQRIDDLDLTERARQHSEQLAFQAVLQADAVLTGAFPDTLNAVVAPMEWTGHVPLPDNQLTACAVTYLGSADGTHGWWLHYTQRTTGYSEDADIQHIVTLIAPCSCGTYISVELADEDDLIAMLSELRTEPGAPVDCDWQLRIRASSYADIRHTNTEPPF